MQCVHLIWGFCLVPVSGAASLFGFKDFIAAIALLIVVYTVSDIRYRFRVSVAPTPLFGITYALIIFIGFGTLATDIWISAKWLVPDSLITTAIWQVILAALFLGLVITWMHYAFIRPSIYGRNNFRKYARELYRVVLKGSESELPVIAHELGASAKSLVMFANRLGEAKAEAKGELKPCAEGYANDMLLLIANRKFCRYLVATSPITAIKLLDAVAEARAYRVPIGLFAQNVSTEAIRNKDSGLYHEDEGYYSGLLGYVKPFSEALYGNYEMVEALENHSPLDVDYKSVWAWDAAQFETYCRVTKMTFKRYLEGGHWGQHSYVLTRALGDIHKTTSRAIGEVRKAGDDYYGDAWHRLSEGVDFVKDCVVQIGKLNPIPEARTLRVRRKQRYSMRDEDLYDQLARAMFEIVHSAAYVEGPPDKAWSIHHGSVWGDFFGLGSESRAWKIVHFKLRRLLYDEILELGSFPNYKAARILGICLNVMGLTIGKGTRVERDYAPLKAVVLAWTQGNYLRLRAVNSKIADACLIGSITFDPEKSQLVKTYLAGLRPEPDREYLSLDSPPPPLAAPVGEGKQ
jgi:hypothetical protein